MCSQGSKDASYSRLLFSLMFVIFRKYFTSDCLNYDNQSLKVLLPASRRKVSTGTAEDNAIGFPLGGLMQWGGFWWEVLCHEMWVFGQAQRSGQQRWSGCSRHEAAPHPVQFGRQMWGVVPHSAWAMHVISSLVLQRLYYSRDCFQIIISKFPPCNNRNLI